MPFCTWLLIGYFRTIPMELDEAALIDGASRVQILWTVVLPIALPGLAVVALFAFTHSWNEFLYALVYVYSADAKTFTAGLTGLMMGDTFIWGQLMAELGHRHPARPRHLPRGAALPRGRTRGRRRED